MRGGFVGRRSGIWSLISALLVGCSSPKSASIEFLTSALTERYVAAVNFGAQGRFDSATAAFGAVLAADPLHTSARLRMRVLNDVANGRVDRSVAMHLFRAVGLSSDGHPEEALVAHDSALAIDSAYDEAYRLRGRTWVDLGEYVSALEDYDRAIRLNPGGVDAYLNRTRVYGTRGEYDRAIAELTRLIAMAPNSVEAVGNRGGWYFLQGRFLLALRDLDNAIELEPAFVPAYMNKALIFEAIGRRGEALRTYNAALSAAGAGFPAQVAQIKLLILALEPG